MRPACAPIIHPPFKLSTGSPDLGVSFRLNLADHEAKVLEAIRNTAFGTIEIVIHQSKIVQLTRSEKVRFEQG